MPVAIPSYRMVNSGTNSRKPSGSSAHSGVHSPARGSPDPMANAPGHRGLSPNSAAMLGAGKYSDWAGWNSPAGSSDNLTNRTASISSSSSPVDYASLTDFPHCPPLNTAWDSTRKAQLQVIGQRGYSPNTGAEWELDIIHAGDTDAELASGMRSLGVSDRSPKLVHKPNGQLHGRAVSYAGALGVSDVQLSGAPMPAPHSGPTVHSASLHHQRSDPSIAQSYSYGQHAGHDYAVYYSNVPAANFGQYSYGAPSADPSVFGSPVPSNAAHRASYGMPGYSTPSPYYPDTAQAASSYYYNQGLVYSPQMAHAPMPGAMHSPAPSRSKQDMRGTHFGAHHPSPQLTHQQRMLISAMPPGTAPISVPSEPFSQYPVSNQLFGMGQGLNAMLH
ncbi:hypothetical protein RSAG8_02360, partial [Rhizoctonia solani AG-8 WAC10335]